MSGNATDSTYVNVVINDTMDNETLNTPSRETGNSNIISASHFVRPTGSWVTGLNRDAMKGGHDTVYFLQSLYWENVTEEIRESGSGYGQCLYYRAYIPEDSPHQGYEAITCLKYIPREEAHKLQFVPAHHQDPNNLRGETTYEIQGDISPLKTNVVHLIIGNLNNPHDTPAENPVVYTWYPGRITPTTPLGNATVKATLQSVHVTDNGEFSQLTFPGMEEEVW